MFGAHELGEGQARIDAGRNHVGVNLVAVREHDALGLAVLDDDLRDAGLGADFDSGFAGGVGDGV